MIIKSTYDIYVGKLLHKLTNLLGLLIPEITPREKQGSYDVLFDKAYPNALAQLLAVQLGKYDQTKRSRAQICSIYNKNVKCQMSNVKCDGSLLRFPLLLNNPAAIRTTAAKQNIFLGSWYDQVVAPKSLNLANVGYRNGSCPVAEQLCRKIINLPLNITEEEALKVIQLLSDNKVK